MLPPPACAWFLSLPHDAQWHGLQVMHDLKRAGIDQPAVLAAALLHDAGKAVGPSGPIVRALSLLALHVLPDWSARHKEIDYRAARGFDRIMAIAYQHPAIAAEQAARCGCDPLTVDLIRYHQDADRAVNDPILRAFQRADDQH